MVTIEMPMPKSCSRCRFEGSYVKSRGMGMYECFALNSYVKADWHTAERDSRCPLKEVEAIDCSWK